MFPTYRTGPVTEPLQGHLWLSAPNQTSQSIRLQCSAAVVGALVLACAIARGKEERGGDDDGGGGPDGGASRKLRRRQRKTRKDQQPIYSDQVGDSSPGGDSSFDPDLAQQQPVGPCQRSKGMFFPAQTVDWWRLILLWGSSYLGLVEDQRQINVELEAKASWVRELEAKLHLREEQLKRRERSLIRRTEQEKGMLWCSVLFLFVTLVSESCEQRQKQLQRELGGARAAKAKLDRKIKSLDGKDEKVEEQKRKNLEIKQQLRKERIEQGIVWQQMLVKCHFNVQEVTMRAFQNTGL